MQAKLLTRKQVAEIFSVTPKTIKRWQEKKLVTPCCSVNGRPRYDQEALTQSLTSKPDNDAK